MSRQSGASEPAINPSIRALVDLSEQRFRLPVLGVRFGYDALVGLVPGVGDFLGMVVGYALVVEGIRLGVSWLTVGRMMLNLWIDAAVGSIPLVGDLFDVYFKANTKNLELLEHHLESQ